MKTVVAVLKNDIQKHRETELQISPLTIEVKESGNTYEYYPASGQLMACLTLLAKADIRYDLRFKSATE
jgi:hypothetical protein